jgi:Ca2+-binding EF-hand superfamily protein
MKNTFLKVMVLGCILTAATASAQEEPAKQKRDPEKMFAKIDTNSDGKISKDEAAKAERPMLKEKFDEIDTNKDSFIDKEELKAFREKQKENRKKKDE